MKQEKLHPLVMMFDFGTLISYIVRFMEISGWLEKIFFPPSMILPSWNKGGPNKDRVTHFGGE